MPAVNMHKHLLCLLISMSSCPLPPLLSSSPPSPPFPLLSPTLSYPSPTLFFACRGPTSACTGTPCGTSPACRQGAAPYPPTTTLLFLSPTPAHPRPLPHPRPVTLPSPQRPRQGQWVRVLCVGVICSRIGRRGTTAPPASRTRGIGAGGATGTWGVDGGARSTTAPTGTHPPCRHPQRRRMSCHSTSSSSRRPSRTCWGRGQGGGSFGTCGSLHAPPGTHTTPMQCNNVPQYIHPHTPCQYDTLTYLTHIPYQYKTTLSINSLSILGSHHTIFLSPSHPLITSFIASQLARGPQVPQG